jgi:hypothetical protein
VGGHQLPLNPDGTVTLYHAAKTPEAAQRIVSEKTLRSAGEPSVYLSTSRAGTGYGDHVVAVNIHPKRLELDDEFPEGRVDFRVDQPTVRVAGAALPDAGKGTADMLGNPLMPAQAPPPGGNPLMPAGGPASMGLGMPGPQPFAAPPMYEPERSTAGFKDRVSTRIPTAAGLGYDPHERSDLTVSHAAMLPGSVTDPKQKKTLEDSHRKNAGIIRRYYGHIDPGITDEDAAQSFIQNAHDNIVHMWSKVRDRPWVPQAIDWYKGANNLAKDMSETHGISHRQAAAVIATLSPQKDWDQNVELAQRVLKVRGNKNLTVTPEMLGRMQQYVDARKLKARPYLEMRLHGGTDDETGPIAAIRAGQKLSDLKDPLQKAMFVRSHDEVHNPDTTYDIISPSGERRVATNADGMPSKLPWSDLGAIANAITAADSDHLPTISRALGGMHKVRNFYNNIIAPDHGGDVTADTHAINVGLLRPMSGFHRMVEEGLGSEGSHSNVSGVHGLYGLHADAYRRAAETISRLENRRLLPREIQSVTWEAVRNMFRKEHKKIDPTTMEPLHPVGQLARDAQFASRYNFMPADMSRDAIHDAAGGVRDPVWWRG